MFLGSKISIGINDIDKALEYLTKIHKDYPNYKKTEDITFDIAVMYDSRGDAENAKKYFSEYLTKFPDGKNKIIARQALLLAGKDLQTYVNGFLPQNDTAAAKK